MLILTGQIQTVFPRPPLVSRGHSALRPPVALPPKMMYLWAHQNAHVYVGRYNGIGTKDRGKNLDTIEFHSRFGDPFKIYEPWVDREQRRTSCTQMANAVLQLGHAVYQDNPDLLHTATMQLADFHAQTGNDLFIEPISETLQTNLPGITPPAQLAAQLREPPLLDLEVLQGRSNLITQVSRSFTMIESLAIYHRVRELYDAKRDPITTNPLVMGYTAFYDLVELERCFARDQKKPLDLLAMSARLLYAFENLKNRQAGFYPEIYFDYVNGNSLRVSIKNDWGEGYIPHLQLYGPELKHEIYSDLSQNAMKSYALGTLRGQDYQDAVAARARDLADGSDVEPLDCRNPQYAIDVSAAQRTLNHPALSKETIENALNKEYPYPIQRSPLNPEVYSRPFSFEVSTQEPIHNTVDTNIIKEFIKRIPPSPFDETGHQAWVEILCTLIDNRRINGLNKAPLTIEKYLTRYPGEELKKHLAEDVENGFTLMWELLMELAEKKKRSLSGLSALPVLVLLAARRISPVSVTELIERFRPTLPFDEIVASLQALHEFYADTIPEIIGEYFGKNSRLAGGKFKRAAVLLGDALTKIKWADTKKVRLTILPGRTLLDAFHPQMGDRNCLIHDPLYNQYSLNDRDFLPHRILVEGQSPENTWRGSIYQVTKFIDGKKIMILLGLDPLMDFSVNPSEFLDGVVKGFTEIAREGGYDSIWVSRYSGSGRRATIQRELDVRYADDDKLIVLPEEQAIPFLLKAPTGDTLPRPYQTDLFYRALNEFYVIADLTQ